MPDTLGRSAPLANDLVDPGYDYQTEDHRPKGNRYHPDFKRKMVAEVLELEQRRPGKHWNNTLEVAEKYKVSGPALRNWLPATMRHAMTSNPPKPKLTQAEQDQRRQRRRVTRLATQVPVSRPHTNGYLAAVEITAAHLYRQAILAPETTTYLVTYTATYSTTQDPEDLGRHEVVAIGKLVRSRRDAEDRYAMNQRYLFLDMDGVLNSTAWWRKAGGRNQRWRYPHTAFDPAAVRTLNAVVAATGASLVLSSSWRRGMDKRAAAQLLTTVGVRGHLAGLTPVLTPDWHHPRPKGHDAWRGDEVAAWLLSHPHASYAILDDDDDFAWPLRDRLVHTDCRVGLGPQHVGTLLDYLAAPVPAMPAGDIIGVPDTLCACVQ